MQFFSLASQQVWKLQAGRVLLLEYPQPELIANVQYVLIVNGTMLGTKHKFRLSILTMHAVEMLWRALRDERIRRVTQSYWGISMIFLDKWCSRFDCGPGLDQVEGRVGCLRKWRKVGVTESLKARLRWPKCSLPCWVRQRAGFLFQGKWDMGRGSLWESIRMAWHGLNCALWSLLWLCGGAVFGGDQLGELPRW